MAERDGSRTTRDTAKRLLAMPCLAAAAAGYAARPPAPLAPHHLTALPALICFTNAAGWNRESIASDHPVLRSPVIDPGPAWNQLVVSWNIQPAGGAGVSVEARLPETTVPDRYYQLGHWSLDGARPIARTSVTNQADPYAEVRTDTLVLSQRTRAVELRLTLHGELARHPENLRLVALTFGDTTQEPAARPARTNVWGRVLAVPELSQVAFAEGRVWCSPTCVTMILNGWSEIENRPEWRREVPEVARAVFDPAWPGTGNWPFNTAYAGAIPGISAAAAWLRDLREVEDLVDAGIPVVLSVDAPALRGEPRTPDGGHLVICVGFTATGDVVVNDPWARLEEGQRVRRIYLRENVNRAWEHSHRLAYLIAPSERARSFPAVWR